MALVADVLYLRPAGRRLTTARVILQNGPLTRGDSRHSCPRGVHRCLPAPTVRVFDAIALVAPMHPRPRFDWVDAQVPAATQPAVCAHSLAETDATMAVHPLLRRPPARVLERLDDVLWAWTIRPLTGRDSMDTLQRCRTRTRVIAPARTLMAQATAPAAATGLVTLSARHLVRHGEDAGHLVITSEA